MVPTWIDFGVAYIHRDCIAGIAYGDIPATPASEACYVIYIYLTTNAQPVVVPYETEEERDSKYTEFKGML